MNHIKEILEEFKKDNFVGEVNEEDLFKPSVTIRKTDLERLGKELLKEINNFLHNNYIITNFPEMKLDQVSFDRSINFFKDKYESNSLNIEEMYNIFAKLYLDEEIDGDLYFKKKSYEDLFRVLFSSHNYLDN